MYDVIQLTESLDSEFSRSLYEDAEFRELIEPDIGKMYTEAVFSGGKVTIAPLINQIQKIKDLLENEIKEQDQSYANAKANERKDKNWIKNVKRFDPRAFWRSNLFKELEDQLSKIFGFRNVEIHPFIEKYLSSDKIFESKELNCYVYQANRYPIDGLVTDKGFYDKTRSVVMQIYISLGLIHALEANEILAVLLHEFGHSIDPALVDIKYTEANILTKYMTDRKSNLNKNEKKYISIRNLKTLFLTTVYRVSGNKNAFSWIIDIFTPKDKAEKKQIEKVRKMIQEDKGNFSRQLYSEAYADNFARMYGMGGALASAFTKLSKESNNRLNSRIKKERRRQEAIVMITKDMLKDEHKTDVHRIRALINEYKQDLQDPNVAPEVRKQMEDDMNELVKLLDAYLNHFDEFQNRVNRIINEELQKIEDQATPMKESADDEEKHTKASEVEKKNDKPKEFVPIFGIAKMYSSSDKRVDGTKKTQTEINSIKLRDKISKWSRGDHYSHALVGFDEGLTEMYSYEANGLVRDNIETVDSWLGTQSIYICVMFVSPEERDKMKKYIKDHLDKPDSTRYSFANMITQNFATPKKLDGSLICSTFTALIMSCSNPKNLHRDYSRIRPEDLTVMPRAFYVMTVSDRLDFKRKKDQIHAKVQKILEEHREEIEDYNNHLPKVLFKDRIDKLGTIDKFIDWVVNKYTGGSDRHE